MNETNIESFTKDDIDQESISPKGPAISYGADYTLDTLTQYVKNEDILIQPGFQRKEVWDKNKSSKLIESFILGYPVPNILLGRPQNGDIMEVIDGQQRIVAISSYLTGAFTRGPLKGTIFKLTGDIAPQYLNKTFEELDDVDQRRLRNSVLKATILVYTDKEPDLKFSVFQRINTGSVTLTQQEIRNCIFGGSFNELLHDLNNNGDWRSLLSKNPDSRMRDEETILRFFASFHNRTRYQKPMTKFLNDFMDKHRNLDDATIESWRKLFTETISIIMNNFLNKGNPFSSALGSKQLNRAVFEAIMVAVAELKSEGKREFSDFTQKHALLLKDKKFQDSVSTGTSSDKKFAQRFKSAMHFLK